MKDSLILRKKISPFKEPYEDVTEGLILQSVDIENNFIYLKGINICSGSISDTNLILKQIGGGEIKIDLSGLYKVNSLNTEIKTQTILSEDNDIELNYGGTHETAMGGGIKVLNGIKDGIHSEIKIDKDGRWVVTPALTTTQLSLPEHTPKDTNDIIGGTGDIVWDDNYIYIKTNDGWRRTSLQNF